MKTINNKISIIISTIWSIFSVVFGIIFIKKNYGVYDNYRDAIGKGQQLFWLVVAGIVAVVLIFLFVGFIIRAISDNGKERDILKYVFPFFAILLAYFMVVIFYSTFQATFYEGDEVEVWKSSFNLYPFFFVYLSEIYIVSFLIVPCTMAPTLLKIVFESLIMGYIIYRAKKHYKSNVVYLLYGFCILEPFYMLGVEIHRMQWYGFIYLFVFSKLFFDILERHEISESKKLYAEVLAMICLIALLSVFRREGMYFIALGPILLLFAYWKNGFKKTAIIIIATFIITEILINIPIMRNGMSEKTLAMDAMLVHTLAEKSLDREKIKDELDVLSKGFDLEAIDRWNTNRADESFDSNFFDAPGWAEGVYFIHRYDSTLSYEEYKDAFLGIVKKQPIPFILSRIRAFLAAGRETNAYNLFIPLILLIVELVYAMNKKNIKIALLFACVFIHIALTTLAMPASFFKYYFEMWLVAYTFFIIMILDYIQKRTWKE